MKREWWIAAAVLLLDRAAKLPASGLPAEGVTLIPGVIGLRFAKNTGMAFSLLNGHPWLLGVLSALVIIAAFLFLRGKKIAPLPAAGLMMMLGGAAGNMIDRFITGYVPDMIEFLFIDFAIFNIADAFLCIGCGLLIISLLFRPQDWRDEHGT
ncbi:MAG: signal peptidase II [Clostridia bacterium]|nr:signal peptidase II [Clostridia bacterium]